MQYNAYRLVAYSDSGVRDTYRYFWTSQSKICSPYFENEEDANKWAKDKGILNDDRS